MLVITKAKPSPWNIAQGLTSPQWEFVWRDAKAIMPLWANGGDPRDITGNLATVTLDDQGDGVFPVWQPNNYGTGVNFPGGDASNMLRFDGNDITFGSTEHYTLAWYMMAEDHANTGNNYIFRADGGTFFLIRRGSGDTGRLRVLHNSTAAPLESAIFMNPGEWHALVLQWDGANVRLWSNGINYDTTAITTSIAWNLGSLMANVDATGDDTAGDMSVFIAAGRAWTTDEVMEWSHDPLGFLEIDDEIFGRVAAVGGATPKGPLGHPFHGPFAGPVN